MTLPLSALDPPRAPARPKTMTLHGETRVDPYFWLREKTSAEVIQYLEAENRYTEAVMKPSEKLQEKLYQEILGRIKQTDLSVPARRDEYLYYSRTQTGRQYPILCRKKIGQEQEEVLIDENELAEGKKYFRVGGSAPSPNHKLFAYSVDNMGDERYTIYVKDLTSGKLLPDEIPNNEGPVEWANDGKTLYYVTIDAAKRPEKVWRHTLGANTSTDKLMLHEKDERFFVSIAKTRSKRYVLISLDSSNTTEMYFLDADHPEKEFKLMEPRRPEIEYYAEDQGEYFYIRTNDGAKNFRLMKAPVTDPSRKNWKEVIAHRADVKLDDIDAFKDYLVVYERENGLRKIRVENTKNHKVHYVSFPESAYSVLPAENYQYETNLLRFRYTSLVTPLSVYEYNMDAKSRELLKRDEVLGGYDPKAYATERVFATAADGAKVPIAIVYKKGTPLDGTAPAMLYAYGAYGLNTDASFSSARLSLLDRGFVYAMANIRGGAEMGELWHDQGKMLAKRNTFTDFISAAEYLIAQKYTSKDKLTIQGGSAGGLLMGAVTNMRSDLFKAVIANVPFVDVLNTMLDPTLPLTVTEYEEWGNPNEKKYYDYMKTYSPYDNVEKKAYPNMLITAGLNDPRVSYWEPAKWAARLRAMKTDNNVLLLKTNMGSGHFGLSGRYERMKEIAFEYAFLLTMVGITN
jgi:oligopeptidase B